MTKNPDKPKKIRDKPKKIRAMLTISPGTIEELSDLDDQEMIAQQIMQHGAIHALEHLLAVGVTHEHVASMLDDLRKALNVLKRIAETKGAKILVDHEH